MSLRDFVQAMPKAELHVHLEGTMQPATLLRLARRRGIDLPAHDEAGLREWFRFRDFAHFVEVYLTCSKCLRDPEDFQTLVDDFLAGQARQNVRWSEVHFTIETHVWNGANGREVLQAVEEAIADGERRHGVGMRMIFDIIRDVGPRRGEHTVEMAIAAYRRGTVLALGLTGFEDSQPNEPFRDHFREAAKAGLHCVAHAGEHGGPQSIRSVIEVCGAERIGHGVRAVEDPALVAELAAKAVPLEICPSSNICLGVFPELRQHSFDRLYRAGCAVTVNSDDPPMFDTTLNDEYQRLEATFGYAPEELAGFGLAGLRHSFLPDADKARLEAEFRREYAALGERYVARAIEPRLGVLTS